MQPRPDTRVQDREVLDEIELYGDLIIAASGSEGPLSEDQIDAILGIRHDDSAVLSEAATSASRSSAALRGARRAAAALRRRSVS